jgi:archaellum component FlaF (FlaF/FlaG flagellin family)
MKNSFISLVCAAALFFTFTLAYTGSVYAQNQNQTSASNAQNETMATITDKPQTTIANQTTIPAEQTTVTVNQITQPMDQSQIQQLGNQTFTQQLGNLSNLENKTLLQPTGPATTIIVNKTTVPFNQTIIEMGNTTN